MVELEKMRILIIEYSYNLDAYRIIETFLVLYIAYIVPGNQNRFVFYINNCID